MYQFNTRFSYKTNSINTIRQEEQTVAKLLVISKATIIGKGQPRATAVSQFAIDAIHFCLTVFIYAIWSSVLSHFCPVAIGANNSMTDAANIFCRTESA